MKLSLQTIRAHQDLLRHCTACSDMQGPPVTGNAVISSVILIGQAPGSREIDIPKPFAWTAGKTLFKWFNTIGLTEEDFRNRVYIAAVCRCFPGKLAQGGDRVPNKQEINHCARWLRAEVNLLKPELIIPVGKLAIRQFMPVNKLNDVVGHIHQGAFFSHQTDIIPLPHPSGVSTWHRTEPGKNLLNKALLSIQQHPSWQKLIARTI